MRQNFYSFLGIDPGATGGWATIGEDGDLEGAGSLPVEQAHGCKVLAVGEFNKILREYLPGLVMLEKTHLARGSKAAFQGGVYFSAIYSLTTSYGVPFYTVPAATWKKQMELTINKEEKATRTISQITTLAKQRSMTRATETFGEENAEKYWPRKKYEGIAEAALIAFYARKQYKEGKL